MNKTFTVEDAKEQKTALKTLRISSSKKFSMAKLEAPKVDLQKLDFEKMKSPIGMKMNFNRKIFNVKPELKIEKSIIDKEEPAQKVSRLRFGSTINPISK